jgi:putative intracellular protease/amidase
MKNSLLRTLFAAVVCTAVLLAGCAREPKILLYMRAVPHDAEYCRTRELEVMTGLLEEAGLRVVVAASREVAALCSSQGLKTDLLLEDVRVAEYAGFLLPDMDTSLAGIDQPTLEMVRQAAAQGKPIAAQHSAITILSSAGLLAGKHYAFSLPVFPEGICDGEGVAQDGLIITGSSKPQMVDTLGWPDTTAELTRKLIAAVGP